VQTLSDDLRGAIASEALKETDAIDTQPLATLVDLELPGCEALKDLLASRIDRFAERWLAVDAFGGSSALLFEWQVDNFGLHGTGLLLEKVGVRRPEAAFGQRAADRVGAEERSRAEDWRKQRFFFKERVYCYLEFSLRHPGVNDTEKLQGVLLTENSFLGEGTRAGRTGLLRSTVLPISELVDRTLCAEYQALSELCDVLDGLGISGKASREFVTGRVQLWTSGASCLSCAGLMRQFVLLFPRAELQVLGVARRIGRET